MHCLQLSCQLDFLGEQESTQSNFRGKLVINLMPVLQDDRALLRWRLRFVVGIQKAAENRNWRQCIPLGDINRLVSAVEDVHASRPTSILQYHHGAPHFEQTVNKVVHGH